MRMSIDQHSIFEDISHKLQEFAVNEILAEMAVSVVSTLSSSGRIIEDSLTSYEPFIVFYDKRKRTLLQLSLLSYYVPEEFGWLLRTSIERIAGERLELSEVRFIVQSETNKNLWLQHLIGSKHPNQIFGNFLNPDEWKIALYHSIRVKRKRTHKRKKDPKFRKRTIGVGYRDDGHLPDPSSPGSYVQFARLSEQKRIDDNRKIATDLYKILEGFLW